MAKTKKEKLEAIRAVAGSVDDLLPGIGLVDMPFRAVHFFADTKLNSCPNCKTYISHVLKDDGEMPKVCPYCGAAMDEK